MGHDGSAIGELWFERSTAGAPDPALLLKLLFTEVPLSIQVHPDDAFAQSLGLPNGKTEAWYVLSTAKGARLGLGLKRDLTPPQLRAAINHGSIADLVNWQDVAADEAVLVPAGTIHAIGGGVVIAEIQQRGDTTFRLFDHGSQRELHVDGAVGASLASQSVSRTGPVLLSDARRMMARSPYFILEQVDLAPNSHWELNALGEVWVLMVEARLPLISPSWASGRRCSSRASVPDCERPSAARRPWSPMSAMSHCQACYKAETPYRWSRWRSARGCIGAASCR